MNDSLNPQSPITDRLPAILTELYRLYPDVRCELNYKTPFQLLVAVILSAQCTDVRVNQVTPALFAQYPTPEAMAGAPRSEIEELIRPTGFFRQKARFIQETSHKLVTEHNSEVPATMPALLKLSGVARKTANVVLGEVYNIAEGIVVDTHVKRLSNRLGLTSEQDPKKIEKDLMAIVPQEHWINWSHLLIFHGRRVCKARRPDCRQCTLSSFCPAAFST